ncbi:MAG: sulfotransferase [Actinobacteria bacterium]|nr:sulfotransferase [Actinomycetota bacterium]
MTAPLLVLGVSRSGTTLLRVVLDRSPGIAIPDESFFIPLLARRHRGQVDRERFLDDVRRLPAPAAWGLAPADVASHLRSPASPGGAIAAIYEAYATKQAKPRWGDKTPMYMRHLPLLERLFPDAQYVHLIRDGRDAALSFLRMPERTFTRTWAHPDTPAEFACLWRTEVAAARRLGLRVGSSRYLEVRYEDLVAGLEGVILEICEFANLPYEPAMLDYTQAVDVSEKPHQQRLLQPLTPGVRDWRTEMAAPDIRAFEAIAGDLLLQLDYDLSQPLGESSRGAKLALARYRATLGAWNAAVSATQRSPLWRRRHPPLTTTAERPARG